VIFDKGRFESRGLPLTAKQLAAFRNTDERGERYAIRDMRKRGGADTRIARPNLFFPVYYSEEGNGFSLKRTSRDDIEIFPRRSDGTDGCWKWGRDKVENNLGILELSRGRRRTFGSGYRIYLNPDAQPGGEDSINEEDTWDDDSEEPIERASKSKSFWWGPELSTDGAAKFLKKLMTGAKKQFEHPKPIALLRRILHMASDQDSIVLDSFAGSGTTAHAVFQANSEFGGQRKFILIETEDYAEDLTAERARRAIEGVDNGEDESLKDWAVLSRFANSVSRSTLNAFLMVKVRQPTSRLRGISYIQRSDNQPRSLRNPAKIGLSQNQVAIAFT
jgi:adenine-specific DNA-methyltransferase